jgi:hypothetical protein
MMQQHWREGSSTYGANNFGLSTTKAGSAAMSHLGKNSALTPASMFRVTFMNNFDSHGMKGNSSSSNSGGHY